MIHIIPSIASADPLNLKEGLDSLGAISQLHLDIEDGNFVPNITFGIKTIRAIAAYTTRELDAHLMVTNPGRYLDDLLEAGIRKIAIHAENSLYPGEYLTRIREAKAKAGLAFNCMADPAQALPYIEDLDYVLVMTAEPDGRGQRFNPRMLDKIRHARALLPERVSIMVDGGIKGPWLPQVVQAGADTLIVGRGIWEGGDPEANHRRLSEWANGVSA